MSEQHSVDNPTEGPATVAWGHEPPVAGRRISRAMTAVRRDPRLAPVVAGLGSVAVVGSLVAEWAVTTLPAAAPDGRSPLNVPQGVNDVGSFGTAYLVGVLGLAGCVALTLFGTPAVRRNVRVGGLTVAAGLSAMLGCLTAALGRMTNRFFVYGGDTPAIQYGRGLGLAFAGVAALAAALLLARRVDATAGPPVADAADSPWRRPGQGRAAGPDDEPAELSVTPTPPFAPPEGPPAADPQPWGGRQRTPPGEAHRYRRESRSGPR